MPSSSGRALKWEVLSLLKERDLPDLLKQLTKYPPQRVINPLIGALCHREEAVRLRAAIALGEVVSRLAQKDLEAARVVMRRLMWMLNEESGGIGWGVPLAMGEILARSPSLAAEYAHILISYLREDGNLLEFEPLQREVLWGLARLARENPKLVRQKGALRYIRPFLDSPDPQVRAAAVSALGLLADGDSASKIKQFIGDQTGVPVPEGDQWRIRPLGSLAQEALLRLGSDSAAAKDAI